MAAAHAAAMEVDRDAEKRTEPGGGKAAPRADAEAEGAAAGIAGGPQLHPNRRGGQTRCHERGRRAGAEGPAAAGGRGGRRRRHGHRRRPAAPSPSTRRLDSTPRTRTVGRRRRSSGGARAGRRLVLVPGTIPSLGNLQKLRNHARQPRPVGCGVESPRTSCLTRTAAAHLFSSQVSASGELLVGLLWHCYFWETCVDMKLLQI
jgi:hypothetical protein